MEPKSERENEGNVCERDGYAARELGREEVSHRAGPYGGKGAGVARTGALNLGRREAGWRGDK